MRYRPTGAIRPAPRGRRAGVVAVALASATIVLGGCSSGSAPAFDLSAPAGIRAGGLPGGQLIVAEPVAIQPLEETRILARDAAGSVSYVTGAQWADRLPRLYQARLVQTFENNSSLKAVGRPGEGLTADFQLNSELRAFQFDAATGEAFVEVAVKVLDVKTGHVRAARVFKSRMPVAAADGPTIAQALDRAFAAVLADIVRWAGSRA